MEGGREDAQALCDAGGGSGHERVWWLLSRGTAGGGGGSALRHPQRLLRLYPRVNNKLEEQTLGLLSCMVVDEVGRGAAGWGGNATSGGGARGAWQVPERGQNASPTRFPARPPARTRAQLHMVGEEDRGYQLELLLTKLRCVHCWLCCGARIVRASVDQGMPLWHRHCDRFAAAACESGSDGGAVDYAALGEGLQIVGMSATLPNVDIVAK